MSHIPPLVENLSATRLQGIDPAPSPDDIALVRAMIAASNPNGKVPSSVPGLATCAALCYLKPALKSFDLGQFRQLAATVEPRIRHRLTQVAGEKLRELPLHDLTGMAKIIAAERIRQGEACHSVVPHPAMLSAKTQEALEMISVQGPAGLRVKQGESCRTVARALGITSFKASRALETIAVEGPAGERVRRGDHCQAVADAFGITSWTVRMELELKAVEGPATQRVKNGESCQDVAAAYGMLDYLAKDALEMICVMGPAKERVQKGESCRSVAQAFGIAGDWPRKMLELIAVDGPAGERIRQGAPLQAIADRYGIADPDVRETLAGLALAHAPRHGLATEKGNCISRQMRNDKAGPAGPSRAGVIACDP